MVDRLHDKTPFLLGELRVDPGNLQVTWPDGSQVILQHRIMLLLITLVEGNGQCVSRETLIEHVWEARFVEEQVLTRAMSDLRKALGDSTKSPRYVATVPKQGYRLLVPVKDIESDRRTDATPTRQSRWFPRLWWILSGPVVIAVLWFFIGGVPREVPRPEVNAAFLKGRYFLGKGSEEDLYRAQVHFEKAMALDRRHLGARKGLAECWLRSAMPGPQKAAMIRDLLEPALGWAGKDAELNYLLGDVALYYERDANRAGAYLTAATRYAPGNAAFLHGLGSYYLALGEGALARQYLDEARKANPVSTLIRCDLSWTLLIAGDLEAAGELALETLNLEPDNPFAHACLLQVYKLQHRLALAKAEALWLMTYGDAPYAELARVENAEAESALDDYDQWRARALWEYQRQAYLDPFLLATAYAQTGQAEKAIAELASAVQAWSPQLIFLAMDPRFRDLCPMEGFQKMVDRTRLRTADNN